MTSEQFIELLRASSVPLTRDVVDDLINAWYSIDGNICGGSLHIVLDDQNWERRHIQFSRQWAIDHGDAAGEEFANKLLTLSDDQLREWLG